MRQWFSDVWQAVATVAYGMWVTLRYWFKTYNPQRGTFTQKFEYPELPVPVAARYRGFHRFDLTTCIACDQCAKACPVDCIYIGKERVENGKGFKITGYTIDYSKCMFCALCVEPCPVDCISMVPTDEWSSEQAMQARLDTEQRRDRLLARHKESSDLAARTLANKPVLANSADQADKREASIASALARARARRASKTASETTS